MASWNVMLTVVQSEDETALTGAEMQALVAALNCSVLSKSGGGIPREFSCTVLVEAEDAATAEKLAMARAEANLFGAGFGGWEVEKSTTLGPSIES